LVHEKFGLKIFLGFIFTFLPPWRFGAAEYDLGLGNDDVWFSKTKFFAGEKVKIYAQINNYGSKDASAYVIFYQGQTTIGDPSRFPWSPAAPRMRFGLIGWPRPALMIS